MPNVQETFFDISFSCSYALLTTSPSQIFTLPFPFLVEFTVREWDWEWNIHMIVRVCLVIPLLVRTHKPDIQFVQFSGLIREKTAKSFQLRTICIFIIPSCTLYPTRSRRWRRIFGGGAPTTARGCFEVVIMASMPTASSFTGPVFELMLQIMGTAAIGPGLDCRKFAEPIISRRPIVIWCQLRGHVYVLKVLLHFNIVVIGLEVCYWIMTGVVIRIRRKVNGALEARWCRWDLQLSGRSVGASYGRG
ncbi:MAG: hypothetical protein NXY57DRAFT_986599 [Lentinula lateritia]|uniref:Uncharacterized protein n=1 Tax=Lentinula lateritia TaxID=40482 RepID=A0ABQ8VKW0_9AGAR|nr:MAG: hypothetical protein NXY57DRAFT_986599 [Lentinula lateritia]KAJ4495429.1 hypothetical protein C8R41DRAFT_294410 [Lentinula lateritia]